MSHILGIYTHNIYIYIYICVYIYTHTYHTRRHDPCDKVHTRVRCDSCLIHRDVMSHTGMSCHTHRDVTDSLNESYHTHEWDTHITLMNETLISHSWMRYQGVVSHRYIKEPFHTYMSHICISKSDVTHACHTHAWDVIYITHTGVIPLIHWMRHIT